MRQIAFLLLGYVACSCESDSFHRGYVISQVEEPLGEVETESEKDLSLSDESP